MQTIFYIFSTSCIIYTIRYQDPIKSTYYDNEQDTFLHWKFGVIPCAIIALLTHLFDYGWDYFDVMEYLWTFSIYLEAIAMLPQLLIFQKYRDGANQTIIRYICFMGLYRAFYILNWIYRSYTEPRYRHHWVVYICGVIQTLLYANFFYYQFTLIYNRLKFRSSEEEEDDAKVPNLHLTEEESNKKTTATCVSRKNITKSQVDYILMSDETAESVEPLLVV